MSGKPYTMREMKIIVEYLTERKLYGELKGRKMWMDFASSKLTNRTWQSLKETFLKRILPDIHNPYYKLTMDQIRSFQQGYDVLKKDKNKLEFRSTGEEKSDGNKKDENEEPGASKTNGGHVATGENTNFPSTNEQDRLALGTVSREHCYATAEELRKVLESPKHDNHTKKPAKTSVRDFITYTEPLTPMLQKVLDDFATDEESDPQMTIVEDEIGNKETNSSGRHNLDIAEKNPSTENDVAIFDQDKSEEIIVIPDTPVLEQQGENNNSIQDKAHEDAEKNQYESRKSGEREQQILRLEDVESQEKSIENNDAAGKEAGSQKNYSTIQMCSNTSNDTILPNNQEALYKRLDKGNTQEALTGDSLEKPKSRERTSSSDTVELIETSSTKLTKQASESGSDNAVKKRNSEEKKEVNHSGEQNKNNNTKLVGSNLPLVLDKSESEDSEDGRENLSELNPCLKSVNLYAEQFSQSKYSSSESENNADINKKAKNEEKIEVTAGTSSMNKVIQLKSQSESSEDKNRKRKVQRSNILSNLFGLSSGNISRKKPNCFHTRPHQVASVSRSHHASHNYIGSASSEWTSESDSDYVSPPRGRRNRLARKYLKPQSARVYSLEDEGGLFVMYGKKIFPLVKDGKTMKHYLTYLPESETEEQEAYWKLKYVEEKQKTAELTKLLNCGNKTENKRKEETTSNRNETASPILLPRKSKKSMSTPKNASATDLVTIEENDKSREAPKKNTTLKIKFIKNNEEVQLEGHWSHIHPVLKQVAQIFHKETEQEPPIETVNIDSGMTTPVIPGDEETRKRVDEIEQAIFKEIERRDKENQEDENQQEGDENNKQTNKQSMDSNVTKRKLRARKNTSSSEIPGPSGIKKAKTSKGPVEKTPEKVESTSKIENVSSGSRNVTRSSKSASKVEPEPHKEKTTERSTRSNQSPKANAIETPKTDDEIRYKLPSQLSGQRVTRRSIRSVEKDKKTKQKIQKNKKSFVKMPGIFSSPDNSCQNSMESTQGYQESDASPISNIGRKRKMSLSHYQRKRNRTRHVRRTTPASFTSESSCDSSSLNIRLQKNRNSSLDTEAYRSESYQLLLPKVKRSFVLLEKIDEARPIQNVSNKSKFNFLSPVLNSNDEICIEVTENKSDSNNSQNANGVGNSSNVSLPPSPEISIVESLSVNRNTLGNISELAIVNEMKKTDFNKYNIADVDVSIPLMDQDFELHEKTTNPETSETVNMKTLNQDSRQASDIKATTVTESLLNNIDTVNIEDSLDELDDSLDNRLRNLLLESAKKMSKRAQKIGNIQNKENAPEGKKGKVKKRCSTPRKRKSTVKSNTPSTETVSDEQMETCSYSSRKSCLPSIVVHAVDKIVDDIAEEATGSSSNIHKAKTRKKKDIIKVKILKPKDKRQTIDTKKLSPNLSVHTDSGVKDTESGVFSKELNDSIKFIHNHSDTCLNANGCVDNESVDSEEADTKSVISLSSSCNSSNQTDFEDGKQLTSEMFSNNAQDVPLISLIEEANSIERANNEDVVTTEFHTALERASSFDSLITEDLSDKNTPQKTQKRTSNWFLLSEDENSNANFTDFDRNSRSGFGSNLNQIFPITCTIPNLSTITEMSKENENTPRIELNTDTDTRNDLNSKSSVYFNIL